MRVRAAVIGAGSWGTALANLLARAGQDTRLWSRGQEVAHAVNDEHRNSVYLPGLSLEPTLRATTDMAEALDGAALVVFVVPSHAMRETAARAAPYVDPGATVVSASKGLEENSFKTMFDVLVDEVGQERRTGVISGPSFAAEVASGQPTVVVAAASNDKRAERIQTDFACEALRVYSSTDVVGVEIGGCVKNIMAIATGASDGLGFGDNARAATITRGLAETIRLAVSLGARAETLAGLSGLGDLVLTCTGELSRNHQLGVRLGRGETLAEVSRGMRMVAEGVGNTRIVKELADRQGVEMPIVEAVYRVLYEDLAPAAVLGELFGRSLKPEFG